LSGLLFRLFFEELRLYIFTLKFVKYDSILLILRKKSPENKRSVFCEAKMFPVKHSEKSSQTSF